MSKTVTFTADVYPYCVGDVVVLSDDELKQVDQVAKARNLKSVYDVGASGQVTSSAEADRQAANLKAAELYRADAAAAKAQLKLEKEEAAKADAAAHNSASGQTTPGSAGGNKVVTAK